MIADLTGRIAFVTGAGSGIGRATVQCLLEQGAIVHATDIDPAGLAELAADLAAAHGGERLTAAALDVTDRPAVRDAVDAAAQRLGRIDVLVCSAGVVRADEAAREANPGADWDRCMAVNLYGTVHACEAATPHLRDAGGGAIVTIGSISAHAARHTAGAYPTSKAAALRYTKSLALQLAPDVRVNAVCPGPVWTGMQARLAAEVQRRTGADRADDQASFFARYEATTPLKRPQEPVDIAKAVIFLASHDARSITGQCLHVDGGIIIRD